MKQLYMKLTLRDLFWLTVVVAICCGWWVERSKLINRIQKLEAPELNLKFNQELFNSATPQSS